MGLLMAYINQILDTCFDIPKHFQYQYFWKNHKFQEWIWEYLGILNKLVYLLLDEMFITYVLKKI
jgi:hypothetical protein